MEEEQKKKLINCSRAMIILVIMDIGQGFGNLTSGAFDIVKVAKVSKTNESAAKIAIYIPIAFIVIYILLKVLAALKGRKLANEGGSGEGLHKLLTFLFVLEVLGLLGMISGLSKGTVDVAAQLSSIVNVIVIYYFMATVKKLTK